MQTNLLALDKDLANLDAKVKTATGKAKEDLDAKIPTLHVQRDAFAADVRTLSGIGLAAWDATRARVDKEWSDLRSAWPTRQKCEVYALVQHFTVKGVTSMLLFESAVPRAHRRPAFVHVRRHPGPGVGGRRQLADSSVCRQTPGAPVHLACANEHRPGALVHPAFTCIVRQVQPTHWRARAAPGVTPRDRARWARTRGGSAGPHEVRDERPQIIEVERFASGSRRSMALRDAAKLFGRQPRTTLGSHDDEGRHTPVAAQVSQAPRDP